MHPLQDPRPYRSARTRHAARALTVACLLLLSACGKEAPPPKVLVIGLDGATFDLIDPWMKQGLLPRLQALREEGVSGDLLSVLPPLSPPAWTTAVTGVNPGSHGIYDFFRLDPDSMIAYTETARSRRVPALWTLLSEAGRKVGFVNVPMSDPPDPLENGFMIAGLPHPDDKDIATPASLDARLHEEGYRLDRMGEALVEGHEQELRDEIFGTFEKRRETALELGEENPDLDLYWVVFTGTDRIQHFFWKFMEKDHPFYDPELAPRFGNAIRDLWVEVDGAVGDLVDQARAQAKEQGRELAVVVLSDHGFAPVHRAFRPQSFLRHPPDGKEPISDTYSLETNASMLYVPVVGREPTAVHTPAEQGAEEDEILARILAVKDPEGGAPPVLYGAKREDLYHGRYVDKAPDLVFLARPPYYLIHEEGNKEPFGTPKFSFSAHHEIHGILIAAGPMFGTGVVGGREMSLLDVSPTLMYLAGETVPGYMEGEPLEQLFTEAYTDAHPVVRDDTEARETGSDVPDPVKAIPYLN